MASFGPLATPPSSHTPTAATVYGVKRERENDDDDTGQKPAPRKRVTISRKPCIVCTEDTPKNRFPKLPHKQDDNEKHSSDVCFKCFSEHLRVEVETKGHEGVACPQCSKPLEESDIRKLASSWTYREYLDKAAKKCMQEEEEYHACPNAECSWGAYFAKDDGNIFSCSMCKARYCLVCEVPFHEGQTCAQYQTSVQQRSADEQKSLDLVREDSHPCPGCGANIHKTDGCDHMTCSLCHHEFCYECFAPYHGDNGVWALGNSAHEDTCSYSPRSLPTYEGADDLSDTGDEGDEGDEGDDGAQ